MADAALLGLDLGGTNIKASLVTVGGDDPVPQIIASSSGPTEAERGPDHVADRIIEIGQEVSSGVSVSSVGVGVPGLFDYASGDVVFFTNLPGDWEGFPLRSRVAEGLGSSTTLINDARAFTLAEGTMGAGRASNIVACLTLGTGIGGGLMIDGRLHFGAFGTAGEIGHQTIDPDGPVCGCGNQGCLEAVARPPIVAGAAGRETFEDMISGVEDGDADCKRALEEAIGHMAIGLANVFTVFGPERFVIGGGGAEAGHTLLDPLRREVRRRLTLVPPDAIEIVAAELGPFAGSVGAALASQGSLVGDAQFLLGEVPSAALRRGNGVR